MRILHTSDWHLGRIFHGVHLTDDQSYILEQFVQLVIDQKPEVVLIAGDVYDRSVPPIEAVRLLDEVLSRILLDARVPVILIAGNHDSPERLEFGASLLARQGLHIAGQPGEANLPVIINDSAGPVCFCPIPYAEPSVVRAKLAAPDAIDHNRAMQCLVRQVTSLVPRDARAVALAHAFVAGGEGSESERPLSIGGSGMVEASCFQPFHYVALGHLHQPQNVGGNHIRYAGSLLKYSFAETARQKSVTLVDMDGAGEIVLNTISLSPRREVRCLEGCISELLAGPQNGESKEDYLMVTLTDQGAILDAIGKLREVYPNVLHIERPHLLEGGELRGPGGDHRRLNELDLFSSFFEQVTGAPLSDGQARAFTETVEALYRQNREVISR
ncbi:MAG: exonuclease SbcCD subunit D [Desulfotomaculaceae bacterium]|nr:exonuclease SbcCD subunit D [Desulfotomaculaceae bacterium]